MCQRIRTIRESPPFPATMHLFAHYFFLHRDLPLPTPSIYNMDSGSSLSVQTLGDSIELSAVLTPDGIDLDESVPSPNPPPLKLAEINAEFQDHQEFIDKLDMVCHSANRDPSPG